MGFFNKVILLGNVTRNPELRYIPGSGTAVVKTALAVNRKFKTGAETREEVMFIDIVIFGKQAETIAEYVTKGMPLLVEGRLSQNTWEQDGQKRTKHEIVVDTFQMVSGRRDRAGDMDDTFDAPASAGSAGSLDEDDIPF